MQLFVVVDLTGNRQGKNLHGHSRPGGAYRKKEEQNKKEGY